MKTSPSPVRQNARPILAFDGFKRVISVIKYQEFMPAPSDADPRDLSCDESPPHIGFVVTLPSSETLRFFKKR
jgi:hypothetical protein